MNIRPPEPVLGIKPAGTNASIVTASDIGGQAISNDHCLFPIKCRNGSKAAVKEFLLRLICSHALRDKNPLKVLCNPRVSKPAILNHRCTVGHQIQRIASLQRFQQFQCTRHKIMPLCQRVFIAALGFLTGGMNAQLLKQQLKPPNQHLIPCQLLFLQQFPLALIDLAVPRRNSIGGFYAGISKRLPECTGLRLVEIQQRVIQI